MDNQDIEYMQQALKQAERAAAMGEVPIGAVVVYEDRVIAADHNRRETDKDPAGHAEFLAMKKAAEVLDAWRLSGCTVYVTVEPCVMCAGLMHQSRIDRCVYGAPDPKAGALGSLYSVHSDERLNHVFAVEAGVLQQECGAIISNFFAEKRAAAKRAKRAEKDQSPS